MRVNNSPLIFPKINEIHEILFKEQLDTNIDFLYGEEYNQRILDYQKRLYKKTYESLLDDNLRSRICLRDFLGLCIGCYHEIPAFYDVDNDLAIVNLNHNSIINLTMHEIAHKKIIEGKLKFKEEKFARKYIVSDEEEDFCSYHVEIFTGLALKTGKIQHNLFYDEFEKLKSMVSDKLFIKELKEGIIASIDYSINNFLKYSNL